MFSNTLMMSNVIIFLLLSFMLILASGEYEWRRRKQWDYWIFCELGQRRWYDEIIWLANPGSWPGGEYNQQKLYKVIRGEKTKWTKNKEMNPICHNKKTKKSVFRGKLFGPWTWYCKILPSLLTGQEQDCSRISWMVGCLFVRHHDKMTSNTR